MLPKKWSNGLKIRLDAKHWLPRAPDGVLPEISETQTIAVPPYAPGKMGERWVVRGTDGKFSIILSGYQPDHKDWPGRIKGWPVPSKEYLRRRQNQYVDQAESDIKSSEELLRGLVTDPDKAAAKIWEVEKKYSPEDLIRYFGPSDPKYKRKLKMEIEGNLTRSKLSLKRLREAEKLVQVPTRG